MQGGSRRDWSLGPGWIIAITGVIALGVALRAGQLSIFDITHSDELMQYLEQGNRLATGHGIVPWESRLGLRNTLIPQFLSLPLWLGHALAPGTLLPVWFARACFMALTLLVLPAAWKLGATVSRAHGLVALFVASVWWESVLFSDLLLSGSLGTALILLGAALLLDPASGKRALVSAGVLVALAVLVRLQFAVFAGVLALAALRLELARWRPFLGGCLIAALIGALSDMAAGLLPFSWIWVNFQMNIGAGKAAQFGTSGPFAYLSMLERHLWPWGLLVMLGALAQGAIEPRHRPLLLAALASLFAHSLIGHKEYRFVWTTVLSLLLLAAVASVSLAELIARRRGKALGKAGLAALLLGWALMSLWSERLTGGARAFRGGAAIPQLANRAADDPKVCGIALGHEFKSHLVPALLGRRLPLYLIPESASVESGAIPAGIVKSADALILNRNTAKVPGNYREVACEALAEDRPCLYRRAGSCSPDAVWSYQSVLEKEDL